MSTNIFVVIPLIALLLAAGFFLGTGRWNQPIGKVIKIIGGFLLLGLIAYVSLVALLIWSSYNGHPM